MSTSTKKKFHKRKQRLNDNPSLIKSAAIVQQNHADFLAIDKPADSLQTLQNKKQQALADFQQAQLNADNLKAKQLTNELEKLNDQISGIIKQNTDYQAAPVVAQAVVAQAIPRQWNTVLQLDPDTVGLTTCGDVDTLAKNKIVAFGMPDKAKQSSFVKLGSFAARQLQKNQPLKYQQYEIDLKTYLLQQADQAITNKDAQQFNADVWSPMAKAQGANSYTKQLETVSNAKKNDSKAQLQVDKSTRIIPHTTKNETLMGAETAFMLGSSTEANLNALVGAKKRSDQSADDISANEMVPWIQANDLYTATTFQGDSAWTKLVELLNETDADKNKDFVILTGSHMDQLGLATEINGDISWNYGTDHDSKAKDNWRPTHFYKQDVDGAKKLLKDLPDINIEVRDIWHPDLPKPSIDTLRAEIKEIIQSGRICIIPSCYSSDMLIKGKTDPKDSVTNAQFRKEIMAKRNIPVDQFVKDNFGDLNDFKRPK